MVEILSLVRSLALLLCNLQTCLLPVPGTSMCFLVVLLSGKTLLKSAEPSSVNLNPSWVWYCVSFFVVSENAEIFSSKVNRYDIVFVNDSLKYWLVNHSLHPERNTVCII